MTKLSSKSFLYGEEVMTDVFPILLDDRLGLYGALGGGDSAKGPIMVAAPSVEGGSVEVEQEGASLRKASAEDGTADTGSSSVVAVDDLGTVEAGASSLVAQVADADGCVVGPFE